MKRFFLTVPGKVILFLVCLFSAVLTAGCVFGAAFMANEGYYTHTEQALFENEITSRVRADMYNIADQYFMGGQSKAEGEIGRRYAADRTNLRFRLLDEEGDQVCSNVEATANAWTERQYYMLRRSEPAGEAASDTVYYEDAAPASAYWLEEAEVKPEATDAPWCCVQAYLQPDLAVADSYSFIGRAIHLAYSLRYAIYPIGILCFLLTVASFVALMCVSGRRRDDPDLHPGPLNSVPFDILIAGAVLLGWLIVGFGSEIWNVNGYLYAALIFIALFLFAALGLGLCMAAASRVKQKNLLSNTLIWRILSGVGRLLRGVGRGLGAVFGNLSLVWRTVLILAGLSLVELLGIGFSSHTGQIFAMWLVEKLIFVPIILYLAVGLRRLQQGGQALAAGDIDYQVDTSRLLGSFRRHGENLNSIGDGMSRAVAQRLKSERLKTELITNVSHDIKTPLTSIINYADLIGKEECDNEKIAEYSAVLLRQSERLKRLIDDLVEASKAQTGNLEVELSPCDVGVFISQAEGEYQDKLKEAGLTLVAGQPAKEVLIMADGRRLWRVFDNLMNNAAKYSQPGTRVYLTLYEESEDAVITFRNTSRESLNISPDELMERFVRGDSARTTEGNGLGLSIAKSLTELQKGTLDIDIDGDLFKVTLRFPILRKTADK